ncbi:MAG: DNA-3-methyladenine glycosylase family protein, partial [Steroidobacteraceae bacterium]
RIPGAWDPFECAVRAVLGHELGVDAERTLAATLVARLGKPVLSGAARLTHLFPSPAALAVADHCLPGRSVARTAAIQTLARAVCDGTIDFDAPVDEVTAALAALNGVAEAAAQYLALRALGEPDAFPMTKVLLQHLRASSPHSHSALTLTQRVHTWRPWRSYAAMLLWCPPDEPVAPSRHVRKLRERGQRTG